MLWSQSIKVFTDHANLMQDALGLTLDQLYQWRLLPERARPKIVNIKGIHNTVADAISHLEYDPSINQTAESYFMKKSQELKTQSETKLDGSLKTMVQTRNRHHQT
jgi:hypothetical protein